VRTGIDILENELLERYPQVFNILLFDHTTNSNIFWATDNYEHLGEPYSYHAPILPELITGDYGSIIMPRVHKDKILQVYRSKEMAEVFTPSWICNVQKNLVDNAWFGRKGVFNSEVILSDGTKSWETNYEKIQFTGKNKWLDYISDNRLELSCGEAPYITSRYDSTTGEFIPVEKRIGILDRKLRVVNENVNAELDWLKASQIAFKSTYAFEWQGDSLLIAREALLTTFIENFKIKFDKEPNIRNLEVIANIISWNVWQMDGLKGVIPNSCSGSVMLSEDLFGNKTKEIKECSGCKNGNITSHNGIYCTIMDWGKSLNKTKINDKKIKFIDIILK
jgi:hypothetical protein